MMFYALFGSGHYCTCGAPLNDRYAKIEAASMTEARAEIWLRRNSRYSHLLDEEAAEQTGWIESPLQVEGNMPDSERCFCGAGPQRPGVIGAINQDVYSIKLQADALHEIATSLHELPRVRDERERERRVTTATLRLENINDYLRALLRATNYQETVAELERERASRREEEAP